jgi:SAM-dependent methyltransferase
VLYRGLRDRLYDAPGDWDLRRCAEHGCGTVWLDPCPVAEDTFAAYERYYTHAGDAEADPIAAIEARLARHILAVATDYALPSSRVGRLAGRLLGGIGPLRESALASILWLTAADRGKLLDIGSGAGSFLDTMAGLGWSVTGVEPDARAAGIARARGLDVIVGTIETAGLPSGTFDVVTLNHVLEHLADPLGTLVECVRVMAPGGRLIVVTPNAISHGAQSFEASWMAWDPPRHLLVFSPDSLRRLLAEAGLASVELRTLARSARIIWRVSRQIRAQGRAPNMHCGFQPWYWPQSYLFHVLEFISSRKRPVGEELFAIGRSPA